MLRAPLLLLLVTLLLAFQASSKSSSNFVVPDFPDLTVKVRSSMAGNHSITLTTYFKGRRQLTDVSDPDKADFQRHGTLIDCESRVQYSLDHKNKTYFSWPLDPLEWARKAPLARPLEMSGGEVTITTDSVDTGERRRYGSFEARHVKTTITAEPGPGAVSRPSTTEFDGWYLDLAGWNCRESQGKQLGWLAAWQGRQDRIIFRQQGAARRGLPLQETYTKTESGRVVTHKTELLEISDQPLDPSLFEVPADYSPARTGPDSPTPAP